MEIVLLNDVPMVGRRFEVKKVANGYARNWLIPEGLAAIADQVTLTQIEQLKKKYQAELARRRTTAAETIKQLDGALIKIEVKANDQGHLFQGLDRAAIAKAVKQEIKLELDPDWLTLERPIKAIGDYNLGVAQGENQGQIKLRIQTLL
ncbi:MAG: 50S ribosomal protein L9 [Candidatus Vogelbacteria bacterium]|nr:50S ribosomal protein L9 [Candidatus Vogelbacteria bacterium]